MSEILSLRPHHALCLQFFIGEGYGDEFVAGMAGVLKSLRENPDQAVLLADGTDRICALSPSVRAAICSDCHWDPLCRKQQAKLFAAAPF
jgi:hypothetical protein